VILHLLVEERLTLLGVSQSTVAGGHRNRALNCSFVGGGLCNSSCSIQSFIGGGLRNTVTGNVSGVVGGSGNTVSGNYSFAAGCGLNPTPNLTFYSNNLCGTTSINSPSLVVHLIQFQEQKEVL